MRFEWDETKRQSNIRKHGIDFADVVVLFAGDTLTMEDTRFDYGEARYITLGQLKGHVIVVAHIENEDLIRIISARKATKNEEIRYFQGIAD
jgi:uncharacterized DUF497 family protein